MSTLTFEDMDLSPEIMNGLRAVNYEKPTELQQEVIPVVLEGDDLLVNSEDQSGKESSFIIPALERLMKEPDKEGTRILILTPYPEDANRIDELVWAMGYHCHVECAAVDMDGDRKEQEQAILDGVQVLVANPGRLIEILQDNLHVFREIEMLIIDRSEEIVSLDIASVIGRIRKRIMSEYQTLMFTGEINEGVTKLAEQTLEEPGKIGFSSVGKTGKTIGEPPSVPQDLKQGYIKVPNRMKITTLMAHLDNTPSDNCVIFTASKRGTDRLYRVLRKRDLKATSIHGKLSDEKRDQRFTNFVNDDVQYLLVSDISAAELALSDVKQVINYDVPNDPDEYRHRANLVSDGKASRIVSMVSKQDQNDIGRLKNELGQAPQELPLPDKVKQKLKERKKKSEKGKSRSQKSGGRNNGRGRDRGSKKSRGKKKRPDRSGKRPDKLELPRPSYDKLSGGRSGKKEDDGSGVIGFFKKLFNK